MPLSATGGPQRRVCVCEVTTSGLFDVIGLLRKLLPTLQPCTWTLPTLSILSLPPYKAAGEGVHPAIELPLSGGYCTFFKSEEHVQDDWPAFTRCDWKVQ